MCTQKGGRLELCCLVAMACLVDCFGVERFKRVCSLAALLCGTPGGQPADASRADVGDAEANSRCFRDEQVSSQREEAWREPAPQADYSCRLDSEAAAAPPLPSVLAGSGPPATMCSPKPTWRHRSRHENPPGPNIRAAGRDPLGEPENTLRRPSRRSRPLTQADRLRQHETSRLAEQPRPRGLGKVPPSPLRSGFARCCDLGGTLHLPVECKAASAVRLAVPSSTRCTCHLASRA